ncbi:MAG: hypothetical protein ACRDVG_15130, partial [Jatrophihabitantaceae bacterium]
MRRQRRLRSAALAAALVATALVPTGTVDAGQRLAAARTAIQLPLGGTQILGRYRVVAFYGAPGGPSLGVLGSKRPADVAADIAAVAAGWRRFGRAVQPAMELIATIAQGAPGPDGAYSKSISRAALAAYLRVAHRHRMLLILDFQPGRAQFLDQVERFRYALADPWVSVALDPEWTMGPYQVPGRTIGHSDAGPINAVRRYLSGIVAARHLPDKLLVVHQFTPGMLPDRAGIRPGPGVEIVFHADGFGSPRAKIATW